MSKPPAQVRSAHMTRGPAVALLVLLAGLDIAFAREHHPVWPIVAVYALSALVVLRGVIPARLRPSDALALGSISLASLAFTATSAISDVPAFGVGQVVVLLPVLMSGVRTLSPIRAGIVGALTVVAAATMPMRDGNLADDVSIVAAMLVILVFSGAALVLGLYLRGLDRARDDEVASTRATERLNMAAELHDFVAHHVTGIVTQAQMCQLQVESEIDRDEVRQTLRSIETMAADALASMRHTVHLLRNPPAPDVAGAAAPTGNDDLAAVADLVRRWDLPVRYDVDDAVEDGLPHALQAAAFRVVRESLTNVRKHAATATHVEVHIARVRGELSVLVHDDGAPHRYRTGEPPAGHGLGLVGLRERITALDGALSTGPAPEGGWTVHARIPIAIRIPAADA